MEKGSIRLLCVVSTLHRCGPNQVLLNILRYLDRQQITPAILTLSPEPADSFVPAIESLQIQWASLGLPRWHGMVGKRLRQFVDEHAPNVIQTHGVRADWLAATVLHGYRRIARMDNYPVEDYRMNFGWLRGSLMAQQNIWAWQRIEQVIACSQSVADQIHPHGIHPYVIPNGVDTTHFLPLDPAARRQLRHQLGLPQAQLIIVSLGSLIPRKDPLTLIAAFLKSRLAQDALLLLVGDGVLRQACERLAADHPQIRFAGRVGNVADYLRAADLFCSTSYAEGLPNAVLEAIACGLPVCLSDIAPHREILRYNQRAGVTFPVGDVPRLTAVLNSVPSWRLDVMGKAARAIATEHLSAEKMAAAYQAVYRQVAHGATG